MLYSSMVLEKEEREAERLPISAGVRTWACEAVERRSTSERSALLCRRAELYETF